MKSLQKLRMQTTEKTPTTNLRRVLLVNPSFKKIYEKTSMSGVVFSIPPLGILCIGGSLLKAGHIVKVFDFNYGSDISFFNTLKEFNPEFIGISFATSLIKEADNISKKAKEFNPEIITIGGGPHCSSFPESSLRETSLDIVVIGEGDFTIVEIVNGKELKDINGIAYKVESKIKINEKRKFIEDLDNLPFPAYELYDMDRYRISSSIARKNPVARIETSRGCVFECVYCNKSCFGRTFRVKSPKRLVEEFIKAQQAGFKEVQIIDDGFTTNMKRAKEICDLLINEKSELVWNTITGIRVDKVDIELLKKMKEAGCYRVYFGIESGNQTILNNIKKGITLEQIRNAVKWSKKAKLEVVGYFMIGLPGETAKTMQDTIDFAKSLNLDFSKISITIPLPATELFNELDKQHLIDTYDWEKFNFHSAPSSIYTHNNLDWKTIERFYNKFYREIYFNPVFILKRIIGSIKNKTFMEDIKTALTLSKTSFKHIGNNILGFGE